MTPDQRALIPPPAQCLTCSTLRQIGTNGALRSYCEDRHPMHSDCAWHSERRLTAVERKDG